MTRAATILCVLAAVATVDAKPSRSRKPKADNMPRGFVWPASKAMVEAGEQCLARLDELGVAWQAAKAEGRMVAPITLPDATIGGIAYTDAYGKRTLVMDCQLVLALATFAPHLYEMGVREVRVGSVYRWSKVRVGGKTKDMLSRHALGLAMDVVSFVDDNGREANVQRDYKNDDELLLHIERGINDSGRFRIVLTPKNDPKSHSDHFHIEANPDYTDLPEHKPAS